jgi:hypothetical protein
MYGIINWAMLVNKRSEYKNHSNKNTCNIVMQMVYDKPSFIK